MPAHRSSSWPLAWMWAGLIVYASLHPFAPWQWPVLPPGQAGWTLLWLPMSRYTRFDFWSNFLAYLPLGLLLAVAWLRGGSAPWRAGLQAAGVGVLLSLAMEWTQYVLPLRVPSRMDWALNSAGSVTGAVLALGLQRLGAMAGWQRLRDVLFVPHGTLGLVLLLSWPIGLLFPTPVPLSPGQGLVRLATLVDGWLADTPFADWVPLPAANSSLAPGSEALVTALGLLAPCLVSFVMLRRVRHRLVTLAGACVLGVSATALSTALNFGPDHAMSWLAPPVVPGLLMGLILGCALAFMHRRVVAALGLIVLTILIGLVNQTGADPYFALSLKAWEQGRFIRFHGLAQWIGWVWPLGALVFLVLQVVSPRRLPPGPTPTIRP
ncbi:VanZ family protein [Sphaerotilus sp.]|jgi:VanZ family protein|uniref:VanZ family protein n=1 Tax=Sphaerotilus sp. TaxID=2093942 RepID=UPI0025E3470D|nr:VanZ family protein [Sphaerotilus sp.]